MYFILFKVHLFILGDRKRENVQGKGSERKSKAGTMLSTIKLDAGRNPMNL